MPKPKNQGNYCFIREHKTDLYDIIIYTRFAKKICRKCYGRLSINSNICGKCKNSDLRIKKPGYFFSLKYNKNRKVRNKNMTDKRNET